MNTLIFKEKKTFAAHVHSKRRGQRDDFAVRSVFGFLFEMGLGLVGGDSGSGVDEAGGGWRSWVSLAGDCRLGAKKTRETEVLTT